MLNDYEPSKPGPNTPAGKKRSSQNAIRHGLSGRVVVLPTEDREIYLHFTQELIESLEPATPVERELAQNIADGYWRLKRVRTTEESLYALGYNEGDSQFDAARGTGETFRDHSKAFVNLSIYEQRIQRGIEKSFQLLRELQSRRISQEAVCDEPAKPKQPKPVPANLFVCSNVIEFPAPPLGQPADDPNSSPHSLPA